MINANKGEWSELYCWLSCLFNQSIRGLSNNYRAKPIYSVVGVEVNGWSIVRSKKDHSLYIMTKDGTCRKDVRVASKEFATLLQEGERKTLNGSGSFCVPELEVLLRTFGFSTVKAGSGKKEDFSLSVVQFSGVPENIGVSVKSLIGSDSSLVNASPNARITFEIVGCSVPQNMICKKISPKQLTRWVVDNKASLRYCPDSTLTLNTQLDSLKGVLGDLYTCRFVCGGSLEKTIDAVIDGKKTPEHRKNEQRELVRSAMITFLHRQIEVDTPCKTNSRKESFVSAVCFVTKEGDKLVPVLMHRTERKVYDDSLLACAYWDSPDSERNDCHYIHDGSFFRQRGLFFGSSLSSKEINKKMRELNSFCVGDVVEFEIGGVRERIRKTTSPFAGGRFCYWEVVDKVRGEYIRRPSTRYYYESVIGVRERVSGVVKSIGEKS